MQQNRNGRPSASNDASDWSPLGRPAFRAPVLPSIIGSHSNNNRIKLKKLGSESPEEVLHVNQQHHNCDHNSDNKPNLNSTSLCNSREKKRRRRRKARQSQQLEAELEPASIDQRSHEDKCSPIARRMSLGELDARKEGTVLGDKYGVAQNAIHSIVSSGKGDYLSDEEKVLSNESSEMDLNSGEIDHDSENVSVRSGRTSKRHQRLKERNHQHTIALAAISKVYLS